MKCLRCNNEIIMFSPMPDVGDDFICWGSHVLVETPDGIGLFHYACAGLEYVDFYKIFMEYQLELAEQLSS